MAVNSAEQLSIYTLGHDSVVGFAAEELRDYLARALGSRGDLAIVRGQPYSSELKGLWLALQSELVPSGLGPADGWPSVHDATFDDAIWLDVRRGQGIIAGNNPRSVLLAVYRFLTEVGCRWVRPGADGEFIPPLAIGDLNASACESASYRHRGICIEGADSYENIAEIIDWSPKVGLNAYYIQFREGYTFFERWYTHQENPTLPAEPFSVADAREYVRRARAEIKKRGMLLHAVGHGWTCEPFGIPGLSWDDRPYTVPQETIPYLAEVNGQRALWKGIPLNTNLCYSNPEVRERVVGAIVEYAEQNRDVDILHFWLADGSNNQCECENCRGKLPADFYVQMLNAVDAGLTARRLPTKIVFLIYVDLLWPPQVERIQNPSRFILMFAPITRTYSSVFAAKGELPPLPLYERNQLRFPRNVDENVAFLRAWQQQFQGDSFDYDYHYMWDHYLDPGYYQVAALLCEDIKRLKDIGINGFISCQIQRAFLPTGLGEFVMARTLWDASSDFAALAEDYFRSAFGPEGGLVRLYLARLSELFDPPYLRGERPVQSEEQAARFASIPAVVEAFRPIIMRHLDLADPCWATSWRYLTLHAEICVLLARTLAARARGDKDGVAVRWEELQTYVRQHEMEMQPVFDVFEFIRTLKRRLV